MTNKEKYKQAISALHAAENISLEKNKNMNRKYSFRPTRKLVAVCVCAVLILALGVTAFANGEEIINRIFGWGNNLEIVQETDSNGVETSISILYTDNLTDPVRIAKGKMFFIVNGENIDITNQVSQNDAFHYEYTDDEGNTHYWLIGLNSDELENFGYAEYIKDYAGMWIGGYSARVNVEKDGSTTAKWLESAKARLKIPW